MTVREGILTQVSWREGAVVKKGLAGLLRAGLEPGTRGAKKELICLPEREGWKRRRRAHGSDSAKQEPKRHIIRMPKQRR